MFPCCLCQQVSITCMAQRLEESYFMSHAKNNGHSPSMRLSNHLSLTTQPFTEASLDSLGAVELRNALNQHFDIELPATLAFDHPSINAIAQYITASSKVVDQTSEFILGSKGLSRQSSFHSVQSEFASSNIIANVTQNPTEIFAVSSRLPSPAGLFRAQGCVNVVKIERHIIQGPSFSSLRI